MQKATCLFITACCLLLALSSCAAVPAKETEKSVSNMPNQTTTQTTETTTQATEPVTEGTTPQDTITTEKYTLFWEDGKSYMEHHPEKENESSAANALEIARYPKFSSLREMRQKLIAGDLAPEEIAELMRYAPKDSNVVEICDINKLYEAIYPNDIILEQIILYGEAYCFELANGYVMCLSEESYLSEFDRRYNGTNLSDSITVLSLEKVTDRNAEVMCYDTFGTKVTRVRYVNATESGNQYVLEIQRENEPLDLYIFGINKGAYYKVYIHGLEERPSLEWISSFGLREYVEAEVS